MTKTELKQLSQKLFAIAPEDASFFNWLLWGIAQIDSGLRLLHSLNEHFKGQKLTLKTDKSTKSKGYFSSDDFEIVMGKTSLWGYFSLFPKQDKSVLFHELTHWNQYQNRASGDNATDIKDKVFTVLMAEADAKISHDLFEREQKRKELSHVGKWILNPVGQILKLVSLKSAKKENPKVSLKRMITVKGSGWRKFYENPEVMRGEFSDGHPQFEFSDVMRYYMNRYGLTLDECLKLKKEVLSTSNPNLLIQLEKQDNKDKVRAESDLRPTNAQVLAGTSATQKSHSNPDTTPKRPKTSKLDSLFLSRQGRGGKEFFF